MLTSAESFVQKEIRKLGGLTEIGLSVDLINEYITKAFQGSGAYHESKNIRLQTWNPDEGEIYEFVLAVFTIVLKQRKLTINALAGMVAGRIGLEDHIDQVTTAAECIALMSKAELIHIVRTGSGHYHMVYTDFALEDIPDPDRHEILLEPPPVYTSNYHEDFGPRILGGKHNYHEDNICLDHINRMNGICYQLNKPFLKKYSEAPTFALDTKEKREQWEKFVKTSYEKYIRVCKKGNRFYFNHNDDKRGRCYCEGYYINTQGT